MNFIFLTTLLILLFSLVSTSMTTSVKTACLINRRIEQKQDYISNLENTNQRNLYSQSKKSRHKSDQARAKSREENIFIPRHHTSGENSKLNLIPLCAEGYTANQKDLIKVTLTNLITEIYQDEPFFRAQIDNNSLFIEQLVKEIAAGVKKSRSLAKISFCSKKMRDFYLTLCRGSYKSKKPKISLLNYVSIQEVKSKRPLCFTHLSKPLMIALFGEETSTKIFKAEEALYFKGAAVSRLKQIDLGKIAGDVHYHTHKSLITFQKNKFKTTQSHIAGDDGHFITLGPPAQAL
jgi:hypothetical protein